MVASKVTTLSEFFHQIGADHRVFDIGRRVSQLTAEQFVGFEAAQTPYPQPCQRCALMAIIFWDPDHVARHYVWFLKLPLDEQGLLQQANRDAFLKMLLERVGECILAGDNDQQIQNVLQDCPYSFMPTEEKMAAFNAQATKSLALPASSFYEDALAYFTANKPIEAWPSLAMQGIADVAARLDEQQQIVSLIATIPQLPREVVTVFSHFLEHGQPEANLAKVFCLRIDKELQQQQPDIMHICACLRAISNSTATSLVEQTVTQVLADECSHSIEILATLSGKIWWVLAQDVICQMFLERLAANDVGQQGFNTLIADVLYVPAMRLHIMKGLQASQRSKQLSMAINTLFSSIQQPTNRASHTT